MSSRFRVRLAIMARALVERAMRKLRPARSRPSLPQHILIAHELLLGDTILLTALLAALRARYPAAQIDMLVSPPFMPLYQGRPYGVQALPFSMRRADLLKSLLARAGYDLVLIPAENRLALLAQALRAKWIVGFGGDKPDYKNNWLDELHPFAATEQAWGDMVARLAMPAEEAGVPEVARHFMPQDWPAPASTAFNMPDKPYAVLHVGASTPLKYWPKERWIALIAALQLRGLSIALTCGGAEGALIDDIDPLGLFQQYAGTLDLGQVWHLLAGAALVVSLDTGIAHIARIASAPLVVLFGPGSAKLFGGGRFFNGVAERRVFIPDFPCRNQNIIFRRPVAWAGNCGVGRDVCSEPKCMLQLPEERVLSAIDAVLVETTTVVAGMASTQRDA